MIGQLAFAFLAGSVATVNPCGFALLPAYLARRLAIKDDARNPSDAIIRALVAGGVMTFGFLLIFGLGGGAIALGAGWLTSVFPWAGLVIGVALAGMGLVVLSGRRIGLGLMPRPAAAAGGLRGDLVFGLGYGTASLSCTLPIFLAVMGAAATDSALAGVLSVSAYALGMGTIVVALAVCAALSKTGLAVAFKGLLPYLPRVGGALLFLSGLYVAYFWGYTLFSDAPPTDGNAIIVGERLSGRFRAWLGGTMGQTVTYG
ncbi:MAG: cytochrome c biogenesis CcdA family protein, partial [Alphaproteobacteria bacterium]